MSRVGAAESRGDLHSEQLIAAILDTAADAIITIDPRGIIQSINTATEKLFGYQRKELIGRNVKQLMPQPFHGEHDGYLRNYIRTGKAKIIGIGREVTGRKKDGTLFPIHLAVGEVKIGNRRLFTGIVHDLSERRSLERQIIEASANEQRRIGQELHDGLCQDLIGIAFSIDTVRRSLGDREALAAKQLDELSASVRTAASQARDFSHGLNPVDIRAGGLSVALENLATKVSAAFGVRCTFHWDEQAEVSDDVSATHLYRIAQEGVSNAIKHGNASGIKIELANRNGSLVFELSDNGSGLPQALAESIKQGRISLTHQLPPQHVGTGIGLQTMQYRARVMGGVFTVGRRKGGGTVLRCTLRHPGKMRQGKSARHARPL